MTKIITLSLIVLAAVFSFAGTISAQVGQGTVSSPTDPIIINTQRPTFYLAGFIPGATCYRYRISDPPHLAPSVGWSAVYESDCVATSSVLPSGVAETIVPSHQMPPGPPFLVPDKVYRFDAQACAISGRSGENCSEFSSPIYFKIELEGKGAMPLSPPEEVSADTCYQKFLACIAPAMEAAAWIPCFEGYNSCMIQTGEKPVIPRVDEKEIKICFKQCLEAMNGPQGPCVSQCLFSDSGKDKKFFTRIFVFFKDILQNGKRFFNSFPRFFGLKKAGPGGSIPLPGFTIVDLKANGLDTSVTSPLVVNQYSSFQLAWTSSNATTCATTSVSPFNSAALIWDSTNKTPLPNGQQLFNNASNPGLYTFTITCGQASDSVYVDVLPVSFTGPNFEIVRRGPDANQISVSVSPTTVMMTPTSAASCGSSCVYQTTTAQVPAWTAVTVAIGNVPATFGHYTYKFYLSDGFANGTHSPIELSSSSTFFPLPPSCSLAVVHSGNTSCTFLMPHNAPLELWIEPTICAEDANNIFNVSPTTALLLGNTAQITTTISASAPIPTNTTYAAELAWGPNLGNYFQNLITAGPNPSGTFTGSPLTLSGTITPSPSSFYGGVRLTKNQPVSGGNPIITQCNLHLNGTIGVKGPDDPIVPQPTEPEPPTTSCDQDFSAGYFSFTNFTPTQVPPPISVNFPATVTYNGPTTTGISYSVHLKYDTNPAVTPGTYVGSAQTLPATTGSSVTVGGVASNLLPNTTYYAAVEIIKSSITGTPGSPCLFPLDVSFDTIGEEPPPTTTVGISVRKFTLNSNGNNFSNSTGFLFDLAGPNYQTNQTVSTASGSPANHTFSSVPVGPNYVYTLKEVVPPGWVTTNIFCSAVSGQASFSYSSIPTTTPSVTITYPANPANAAASVACNFTNQQVPS